MADFLTSFNVVMGVEGGYANDPDDTGGETYKGISRKNFPKWKGWSIIDTIKRAVGNSALAIDKAGATNLSLQTLVHEFYKTNFWNVLSLDKVKFQGIATELFDTAVNMGTGVAADFLQITLNVLNRNGADYPDLAEDGQIGSATVNALNSNKQPENILKLLN